MTELTFRTVAAGRIEHSVVGDWWHTVDRWSLGAVLMLFALGLVLAWRPRRRLRTRTICGPITMWSARRSSR